jgi:hypothetical protein
VKPRGIPRAAWWFLRRSHRRIALAAQRRGGGVAITVTHYRAGEVVGMETWEALP